MSESEELKKGLEGVLVGESALSSIDGDAGELIYRGYAIEDLARNATFEEVLYLLWYGELPDRSTLEDFTARLAAARAVDDDLIGTVRALASADETPMAAIRTAVSMLSAYDPDADAETQDRETNLRKGIRVTAKLPTVLAAYTRFRNGQDAIEPREDLGHAANFLYMLNGDAPDEVYADTFDTALVLHADHGLNASTFAAMVTASTLADLHAAITSAIGALSGPLHGGANQNVMRMLREIDESDRDPVGWVEHALEEGRRIPGFGHRVYNVKDPRARILEEFSRELGEVADDPRWFEYSRAIEDYMTAEKGIAANVDFYSASTYYEMGIPIDVFTPIFAMSRVGGWIAHVLEQYDDNRLIRPRARYVGPTDRTYVPIGER